MSTPKKVYTAILKRVHVEVVADGEATVVDVVSVEERVVFVPADLSAETSTDSSFLM